MLYSDSSSQKTLRKNYTINFLMIFKELKNSIFKEILVYKKWNDSVYTDTEMRIWAFSVVLHIGATFSLRENISNRISLINVPPYYY